MVKKLTKKVLDNDTNFWIVIVLAIIILLVLVLVYWIKVFGNENYFNYQGKDGEYKITRSKVGDVIFYNIDIFSDTKHYIYSFRNHPKDLEDIYLEPDLDNALNRPSGIKTLYITRDPELYNMTNGRSSIAAVAFEQILGSGNVGIYNLNISSAFTSHYNEGTPVVDCSNVSNNISVIYLKLDNETKVYSDNGCIIVQGRGSDGLVMAGEKFAYYLLGVF